MRSVDKSPALNAAIESILPRLPIAPPALPMELVTLRALHRKHQDLYRAARDAEAAAERAKLKALSALTDTQVMLELLEEKLGIEPEQKDAEDGS